jgi:alanyl-tRNA synthetase
LSTRCSKYKDVHVVNAEIPRRKAGDIIKNIAPIVGGTGGGRPDLAQAGGRDASKLDEALAKVAALLQ